MRFLKRHWEKLLLALFVVAVCAWGLLLFTRVVGLQEQVTEQEGVRAQVVGERLNRLSSEDFTALRYVDEPRREWMQVEREDRSSLIRPVDLIWCVAPDCNYWLPAGLEICPYCETYQGDDVVDFPVVEDEYVIRPLEQRLFLVEVSREDFGAIFRQLTAISDQPPENWDLQVEVLEADGRRRTRFVQKGDTINVEGTRYRIIDVERKVDRRFNPAINAEITVDRSEVTLQGPNDERITLVRGESKRVGPFQVRFELTDPRDPQFSRRLAVRSDQPLTFRDVDGNRRSFHLEVQRDDLVILRAVDEEEPEPLRIGPRPRRVQQPTRRLDAGFREWDAPPQGFGETPPQRFEETPPQGFGEPPPQGFFEPPPPGME